MRREPTATEQYVSDVNGAKADTSPLENAEPEAEEEEGSDRRMDPELRTMGTMLRQLEKLDEPARGRVVNWLASRYAGTIC